MKYHAKVLRRIDAIDALRGCALVWMALYHFCFDLNNVGFLRQDFYRDPLWTTQRTVILSLFLLCAGCGQALAWRNGQDWPRFWRRWIWIVVCAVLVSIGSWLMFPDSYIYFGVLHGLAVMLVIVRLTAGWGAWLFLPALLALAAPMVLAPWLAASSWTETFNAPALNWLGLVTRKPVTEDYVPLLPWLGVVWIGVAITDVWIRRGTPANWRAAPGWQAALVWLGRHSLWFYMLHQPVLIGLVWLAKSVVS